MRLTIRRAVLVASMEGNLCADRVCELSAATNESARLYIGRLRARGMIIEREGKLVLLPKYQIAIVMVKDRQRNKGR